MLKSNKNTTVRGFLQSFLAKQESSIIIATVIYAVFVTMVNGTFFTSGNIFNIFRSTGFTLITTVGMTFILITAGLDLSVGSVLALGGVVTGLAFKAGMPVPIAILAGLSVGAVIGAINGAIIVKAGIPPLIVTLGMQYVARGLVSVITQGVPIYPLPESFQRLEQSKFLGISLVIYVAFIIAVIGHLILKRTAFGRSIYAVGGNTEAARISGINTKKVTFSIYVITSTLAALAGILMAARLGSAEAAAGTGYELTVICASIIGGTSTFGGMGSIIGATVGALFMEILTNSLTLMRISVYWQNLVVGVILILAVLLDQYKRNAMLRKSIKK
ncbi:ABC transporter permease [Vallitalea guaymasensis]|uniref:ABC transporter permease n=1 Tax=Vallitalea guaymasensis TaxID=1185412 RepID=A0A8J8MF75_9FIRM|nr:ABC transporter permease [Vallitalea guaymasensis]QUH31816.1 ABC transporter permease [Vallitalea guaymasensis]